MKKYIILFSALLSSCSLFNAPERYPAQDATSCPISEKYPPLFNVLQANSEKIIIRLDNFKRVFNLPVSQYDVTVKYIENKVLDREGRKEQIVHDILSVKTEGEPYTLQVPVNHGGLYHVELSLDGKSFWRQKVFALHASENTLSTIEKEALAIQYAPIMEMSPDEMYFPSSLEYIYNKIDSDPELAKEQFLLTTANTNIGRNSQTGILGGMMGLFGKKYAFNTAFEFQDVDQVLPYYGHSESVLKSALKDDTKTALKNRKSKDHLTVYYSVFENKQWNEIYINYHYFYAFDSKNGTADKSVMAAHIFDRESLTVVLRGSSKKPLYTFYGAHLPSQKMAQLDSNKKVVQAWLTGRVFVNWDKIISENGRLKAVAAKGSHGIYPIKGLYAVMANDNFPLLLEPAGGGEVLYPEFDQNAGTNLKYKLRALNLDNVSSSCHSNNRMLVYSGSTVDVLGPVNATFPPFTDREGDYKNYADPNAPMFDMEKAAAAK
jgi:hypothetical protein